MLVDAPSPGPSPSPGPVSTCAVPTAPPHVLTLVRPVGAEQYLSEHHRSGVVDIKVYLAADGTVSKAVIVHSSGDAYLDGATYDAAVATTYRPEIRDCLAVSGAYIYRTRYSDVPAASPTPAPAPSPTPRPTPTPTPKPAAVVTNLPTTVPTTIATTIATTVPTTVPTTLVTTIPTTVPTTYATTVPARS